MKKLLSLLILAYGVTGCGLVELWDAPFSADDTEYDAPESLPPLQVPPPLLDKTSVKHSSLNATTQ